MMNPPRVLAMLQAVRRIESVSSDLVSPALGLDSLSAPLKSYGPGSNSSLRTRSWTVARVHSARSAGRSMLQLHSDCRNVATVLQRRKLYGWGARIRT